MCVDVCAVYTTVCVLCVGCVNYQWRDSVTPYTIRHLKIFGVFFFGLGANDLRSRWKILDRNPWCEPPFVLWCPGPSVVVV